ncbi:MAG: type II toxin-antitoxin system VapC family toxin [Proteobacteria bacterium]|nr:type II toxin-antitoxin system VapC family toxin [Pseudomonadota bacterium]
MPAATEVVVDASALAAVLFDEPEAAPVVASVAGSLIAPTLLRYEIASVCATKLIRHPQRAGEIQARYRLLDDIAIAFAEPDWPGLPALARRWALSAYDAAYLQLALARKLALVTLDARLAAAWDNAAAASKGKADESAFP